MPCLVNNDNNGCTKLANMNVERMKRLSKNRGREVNQAQDSHGKITKKQLPLLLLPPVAGGKSSNDKFVDASLRIMATMKETGLPKENRLQNYKHHVAFPSSLHNQDKEEFVYNYRQDKETWSDNKKRNFVAATPSKRPLVLPPLPTKSLQGQISKQARKSRTSSEKSTRYKMLPKYLPKIETKKSHIKDSDSFTHGLANTLNKSSFDTNLPPLAKRTAAKPLRAAISSSATLRGLITLDLEEQFIFRFRLSNYDAKDINMATLNEPV